jgi:hypothetical protein
MDGVERTAEDVPPDTAMDRPASTAGVAGGRGTDRALMSEIMRRAWGRSPGMVVFTFLVVGVVLLTWSLAEAGATLYLTERAGIAP